MMESGDDPSRPRLFDMVEGNGIVRPKPPPSLLHALLLSLCLESRCLESRCLESRIAGVHLQVLVLQSLNYQIRESQIRSANQCPHLAVVPKSAAAVHAKRKF